MTKLQVIKDKMLCWREKRSTRSPMNESAEYILENIAMTEQFAKELETIQKDCPQAYIDFVNKYFWDLV